MKIEVGEYVRTKKGKIFKYGKGRAYLGKNNNIVKHSKNIINLIEVGDYVNGYRVINVINGEYCPSGKCVDIDSNMQSEECTFWEEDIKSIVTKEQFKQIEYKIGED